jgi:hypothetical protein
VNGELEKLLKVVIMAFFKALSWHLLQGTKDLFDYTFSFSDYVMMA